MTLTGQELVVGVAIVAVMLVVLELDPTTLESTAAIDLAARLLGAAVGSVTAPET